MDDEMILDAALFHKAAVDLEWAELLERIAAYCMGESAAEVVRAITPASDFEEAQARIERAAEAMGYVERGAQLPIAALDDLTDVLERVHRHAVPSGRELRAIAGLTVAAATLRRHVAHHAESAPRLARELATDPGLDAIGARIEVALDPDGAVNEDASPGLRAARRQVETVRRELARKLDAMVSRHAEVLRDRTAMERDGRWVIPVRSDAHQPVPGIVLGSSASGGTLYVEPVEVTPLVNRLTVALGDAVREEQRVLAELASLAAEHGDALTLAYRACVQADVLAAIARWAGAARARPIAPDREPRIALGSMRHPLLLGTVEEVVPHDLAIGGGQALIVSGPNAGGKTVALKSMGLAAWMARAGLPVPAQPESRIGWFDPVLTDFGDEQSIARALSTFSAHVAHLTRILAAAGPRTLVLLDELAGATDPEEGAAFAQAIVEGLVERGAVVGVTTHYERLKEAAARDPRFHNASVGFDLARLVPTFRLALGVPGPSSALAVAGHFGVPSAVIERARALVPEQARARQELLERLHTEREALHQALASATADAAEQARLRGELEAERAEVRQKERLRFARESAELMGEVREARARLREVSARLGAGVEASALAGLEREVAVAAQLVAIGGKLAGATAPAGPPRRPAAPEDLAPGKRVFLKKLDRVAEVVELAARGQVRVMAGPLKLLVPLAEVELVTSGGGASARQARPSLAARPKRDRRSAMGAGTLGAGFVPVRTQDNTLDLRGQRVEESLDRVDAFLDRLLDRGEPVGFVLHGHGTGALKTAVRSHLKESAYVSRSYAAEPDDGGDAFTVAWLKE
ncbi:MAG: Smr/MutS family protein [Polyangiaceae bacterium]|nr:Smr/MutS family protein [Polyangiaceae bacterium]